MSKVKSFSENNNTMLALTSVCDKQLRIFFILQVNQVQNLVILHLKSRAGYPLPSYIQTQALGEVRVGSRNSSIIYKELRIVAGK